MNKIIKTITLILFVSMISSFVAYRSGAFDSVQNDLSNNYLTSNLQLDSPPVKKVIMHSSKSGPVFVEKDKKVNNDSVFHDDFMNSSKSGKIITPKDFKEDKAIMGSSKSMILISPKKDTVKKKESPQQVSPVQNSNQNKKSNKK